MAKANQSQTRGRLLVIGGPTAVGKTQLSIELAQHLGGEIINGDRLQFYRGLDIGTGKVRPEEQAGIPHHALDFLTIDQAYDASQFQAEASRLIADCHRRGVLPILVGGSGLYLEGLLYQLEFGGMNSQDEGVRRRLSERLANEGAAVLYDELCQLDPDAARLIPIQNERRLLRALEVIAVTGTKFSQQTGHQAATSVYDSCLLLLERPRAALYERINQRVDQMDQEGLEAEARWLYDCSQGQSYPSVQGIGYKEWWPYFSGETIDRETVLMTIKQNSRRYAKRQLTWFRNRFKEAHCLDMSDPDQAWTQAQAIVNQWLSQGDTNKK